MNHEKYISRCIELAQLGKEHVSPNPMVGSVIVLNDKIIGEGYHKKHGGAHAEVNAINSVENPELLKQATLYVSLEPCSHFGKTPPCADLIIEKQIPRVIIATLDSNEVVCGNGVKKLRSAGIEVTIGVLENEANKLNKTFNTFHLKKRPFIILKWAETANGFMDRLRDNFKEPSLKISNNSSSRWVHKLRSEVDAILIGKNTALLDNPSLTTRKWNGQNPVRIIIDQNLSLPKNLKVFTDGNPTIIFNNKKTTIEGNTKYVQIVSFNLTNILKELYSNEVQSLLVEGGSKTLHYFIKEQLWDEIFIIRAGFKINSGVKSPKVNAKCAIIVNNGTDQILIYD